MSYKNEIEKMAQARWRKHIDGLNSEDELMDFASQASRNKRQTFHRPGNYSDRRDIGFNKDEMKRVLSSQRGWHFEDGSVVPTNESLRDISKKDRGYIQEMLEDKDFDKQLTLRKQRREMSKANKIVDGVYRNLLGPENKSTSMNAPGQVPEAGPDDLIDIIHGGNKAKAEAFIRGGNGYSKMQTRELLDDGTLTDTGLQFHSKVRGRASQYANMQANNGGGVPAVIEAKIPRKYMYVNTSQGPGTDEMGLPDAYFNKMQDIKVYNPETGEVYTKMKNNKDMLPYGRTKTPGAPTALEKSTKLNAGRRDFKMGEGKLIPQTQSKEAFKEQIKANSKSPRVPDNKALVPSAPKNFNMVGDGVQTSAKRPARAGLPIATKPNSLSTLPKLVSSGGLADNTTLPSAAGKAPKLSKNTKLGLGLGAGALALGAGAYGINKLRNRDKEENQ